MFAWAWRTVREHQVARGSSVLHHAVEMLLDAEAEGAIRSVWERLRDEGVSATMLDLGAQPHATLTVCNPLDPAAFREPAQAFLAGEAPVEVSFASAGTFPGSQHVVFLGPVESVFELPLGAGT